MHDLKNISRRLSIVIKISNCKKFFLIFLTSICSIPHATAITNDAQAASVPQDLVDTLPAPNDLHQENLENLLKIILKQLQTIDISLEELALIVNSNASKSHKKDVLSIIREVRDIISQVKDDAFTNVNEINLTLLSNFTHYVITYVRAMINGGLSKLEPFDWESGIKRALSSDLSPERIQRQLIINDQELKQLTYEAKNVGLRWYNKAYRALDSTVIQPFQKYHIGRYLLLGGLATGAGALLAWQWAGKFTDKFGDVPSYDKLGNLKENLNLGLLGRTNHFIIEHTRGYLPINSWFYTACMGAALPELIALKNYGYKKGSNFINFLKGGGYANKKLEDAGLARVIPKATLKDLIGLDYVKEVFSHIVKYLEDPERFDRSKLTPEKGFLLTGPARTGKTFSAEALAGEIREMYKRSGRDPNDFNFYPINAPLIKYKGARYIFEAAKEKAPCILFIDEIDLLSLQRASGDKELLSEFLTCMSGCLEENDPKKPVIVIGATNQPETMDGALRQPGRFGTEIRYEYPSFKYRKEYLLQKLAPLAVNIESFDIDQVARDTEGCSYEELNAMIRNAFIMAKKAGEPLSPEHLQSGLDSAIRHIVESGKELPAHEKELLAIHQAGHVVMAMLSGSKEEVSKVTIKPYQPKLYEETPWDILGVDEKLKQPKITYGRIFTYSNHDTAHFDSRDEKITCCKIQLAGHAAEKILLGSCGYSYHPEDSQRAFNFAKSIAFEGIAVHLLTEDLKSRYQKKALALREQWEAEVVELLTQHKDKLERVAQALKERESLSRQEILELMFPAETKADKEIKTIDSAVGSA